MSSSLSNTAREPDSPSGGTVAGYFADSADAQRAISSLLEEGFSLRDIGAAFHSSPGQSSAESTRGSSKVPGNVPIRPRGSPATSTGGPESGTEAVFPWGIGTGGGTVFAGAPTRPGPIPGSDIPSTLPREIPSELPSDLASDADQRDSSAQHNFAYSGSAFESSFCGMGIPREHALCLSRDLGHGGAVVTVKAGARNAAAEAAMQRNHGTIRYESQPRAEERSGEVVDRAERVAVFGEIHRVYPGHIPAEDLRNRKAS